MLFQMQTQDLIIAEGKYPQVVNLVALKFEDTQQNANAARDRFRDLQMLMPGHKLPSKQLFSDNWAALMKPFDHLRVMGVTGTNSYSWQCAGDAAGCSVIEWDRALASLFLDKKVLRGCLVRLGAILLAKNG